LDGVRAERPHSWGLLMTHARWFVLSLALPLVLLAVPAPAMAGGFEIPATGTRAAGRGGAFTARADDPTATWYNPANLANLDSVMVTADVHLPWWQSCYQRFGTYGGFLGDDPTLTNPDVSRFGTIGNPGAPGDYTNEAFPRICRQGGPRVTPTLLFSWRVSEKLGLGFGLIAPAGSGTNVWANREGVVEGVNGELRPAPHRYMQVFTDTALVRLAFGAGMRLTPWLRLGGTFLWGMSFTDSTVYGVVDGGEYPGRDVRLDMRNMTDLFVPGAIGSVHVEPLPELDIAFSVNWLGAIRSRGDGFATYAHYGADADGNPVPGAIPPSTAEVPLGLHVPQPISLRLGVRYGMLRPGAEQRRREGKAADPMRDEVFDIELNVGFERNSRINAFTVSNPNPQCPGRLEEPTANCFRAGGPYPDGVNLSVPAESVQPKGFRDQLTLHLGSDVNVVPDRMALRAGMSFETNGYERAMWQLDFQPGRRVGMHLGATVRVKGLNLSVAYARIFQWDTVVNLGEGQARQVVQSGVGAVINEGRYENAWHLFSVSLQYRWGDGDDV
jgi:hypothetical protein